MCVEFEVDGNANCDQNQLLEAIRSDRHIPSGQNSGGDPLFVVYARDIGKGGSTVHILQFVTSCKIFHCLISTQIFQWDLQNDTNRRHEWQYLTRDEQNHTNTGINQSDDMYVRINLVFIVNFNIDSHFETLICVVKFGIGSYPLWNNIIWEKKGYPSTGYLSCAQVL